MAQIPSGIITGLFHPPYGVITRETGFLLTSGVTHLQRLRGPITVDAFGIAFSFFTIPAAFGRRDGVVTEFEVPICQFAPLYTLFDGNDVHGPITDVKHEGELYFFDQLLPKQVDVFVTPDCVVQQFWLVAL